MAGISNSVQIGTLSSARLRGSRHIGRILAIGVAAGGVGAAAAQNAQYRFSPPQAAGTARVTVNDFLGGESITANVNIAYNANLTRPRTRRTSETRSVRR